MLLCHFWECSTASQGKQQLKVHDWCILLYINLGLVVGTLQPPRPGLAHCPGRFQRGFTLCSFVELIFNINFCWSLIPDWIPDYKFDKDVFCFIGSSSSTQKIWNCKSTSRQIILRESWDIFYLRGQPKKQISFLKENFQIIFVFSVRLHLHCWLCGSTN